MNRSIFQNWKPNIFKNIHYKTKFQLSAFNARYSLNFKSKTKLILFSKKDRFFFENYINLFLEKNKVSVEKTFILYPMVTSDYLNETIKIYKNFLELHNIQLIRQLNFLVKMEKDMSKSIEELQNFYKNPNIIFLKNKRIDKIQGSVYKNYNKTKNSQKKIKVNFNGYTLLELIRERYGPFLALTIEADLVELVIDMVYNNIKNNNIDIYENLIRHFLVTEETLKKVEIKFNKLNICYNGKICLMDTKYMYLTYKVLFITVLVYELERNFIVT